MANGQLNGVIGTLRRIAFINQEQSLTDGDLLGLFLAQRDESAFEGLVRRHGPMVLSVCQRMLSNKQDAEDAFQATFLLLARKASSIVPREKVGNWLYGVAYRTSLEARRLAARRQSKERQVVDLPHPVAKPEADSWSELKPILDEELSRLPDNLRLPVVLCDIEGRTRREVAAQLKVPDGTLSNRLASARELLAKRLAKRGVVLSVGALAATLTAQAASASVPASLVTSTVKAAGILAASNGLAAGVVSAKVAALIDGVSKAMFLTKLKTAVASLLVVGLLSLGGLWGLAAASHSGADAPRARTDADPSLEQNKDGDKDKKPSVQPAKDEKPPVEVKTLQEKLKKMDDEVVKIRASMLKECDEELKRLDAAIKKLQEASKTVDRKELGKHMKQISDLQMTRHKVHAMKIDVEHRIHVKNVPAAAPVAVEEKVGIKVARPNDALSKQLGLAKDKGLVIENVRATSAAAKAGLKAYDILVKVNGKTVPSNTTEFRKMLADITPDSAVDVVVMRDAKEVAVTGLTIPAQREAAIKKEAVAPKKEPEKKATLDF